jgi:hypothetical protein
MRRSEYQSERFFYQRFRVHLLMVIVVSYGVY